MTYPISFVPEVENDVLSGYYWYGEKSVKLGDDFLEIFFAAIERLTKNPLQFGKVDGEFRRILLKRFPFAIYFIVRKNRITVYGVFHCARDPEYIYESLHDR